MRLAVIQKNEAKRKKIPIMGQYFIIFCRLFFSSEALKVETYLKNVCLLSLIRQKGTCVHVFLKTGYEDVYKLIPAEVRCFRLYTVNSLKIKCCNATLSECGLNASFTSHMHLSYRMRSFHFFSSDGSRSQ